MRSACCRRPLSFPSSGPASARRVTPPEAYLRTRSPTSDARQPERQPSTVRPALISQPTLPSRRETTSNRPAAEPGSLLRGLQDGAAALAIRGQQHSAQRRLEEQAAEAEERRLRVQAFLAAQERVRCAT